MEKNLQVLGLYPREEYDMSPKGDIILDEKEMTKLIDYIRSLTKTNGRKTTILRF